MSKRAWIAGLIVFAAIIALGIFFPASALCGRVLASNPNLSGFCTGAGDMMRSTIALIYFSAVIAALLTVYVVEMLVVKKAVTVTNDATIIEPAPEPLAVLAPDLILTDTAAVPPPAASAEKKETPAPPAEPQSVATSALSAVEAALKNPTPLSALETPNTKPDFMAKFRANAKKEGADAAAFAQALIDESTLSAIKEGVDPILHLSKLGHLILQEDTELRSGLSRPMLVHISARLKELGVTPGGTDATG